MSSIGLSIAICSINPDNCKKLIISMLPFITDEEIIFILDGKKYLENDNSLVTICENYHFKIVINENNSGLSYCRNLAMEICSSDYLVFLDDDTQLISNTFMQYKKYFYEGFHIGGAKLVFPKNYCNYLKWMPNGYSYLFGVHSTEKKIWGACFGFDLKIAKINNITFDQRLGRKGSDLQSGDDTLFVQKYMEYVRNNFFIEEPVYHCYDRNRFRLRYIVKRIYWQGKSEIRRNNFKNGLKKEIKRSSLQNNSILKFLIGKILVLVFLYGTLEETIRYSVMQRNE